MLIVTGESPEAAASPRDCPRALSRCAAGCRSGRPSASRTCAGVRSKSPLIVPLVAVETVRSSTAGPRMPFGATWIFAMVAALFRSANVPVTESLSAGQRGRGAAAAGDRRLHRHVDRDRRQSGAKLRLGLRDARRRERHGDEAGEEENAVRIRCIAALPVDPARAVCNSLADPAKGLLFDDGGADFDRSSFGRSPDRRPATRPWACRSAG